MRKKIKKLLDWLAYISLICDMIIAVITIFSLSDSWLKPINIILTTIVILSSVSFIFLLIYKIYEKRGNVKNEEQGQKTI